MSSDNLSGIFRISIVVICVVFLFTGESSAQVDKQTVKSCALLIQVNDPEKPNVRVANANVSVKAQAARKTIKPVLADGLYLFPRLAEGKVSVEVSRKGFEKYTNELDLRCREFAVTIKVELQKIVTGPIGIIAVDLPESLPSGGIGIGVGGRGVGRGSGLGSGDGGWEEDSESNGEASLKLRTGPTTALKIIFKPRAVYTDAAREKGIEGVVLLRVQFQADGKVGSVGAVKSLGEGLTESAINAAKKIRFEPAMRNGVPYTVIRNVEYPFRLY